MPVIASYKEQLYRKAWKTRQVSDLQIDLAFLD